MSAATVKLGFQACGISSSYSSLREPLCLPVPIWWISSGFSPARPSHGRNWSGAQAEEQILLLAVKEVVNQPLYLDPRSGEWPRTPIPYHRCSEAGLAQGWGRGELAIPSQLRKRRYRGKGFREEGTHVTCSQSAQGTRQEGNTRQREQLGWRPGN